MKNIVIIIMMLLIASCDQAFNLEGSLDGEELVVSISNTRLLPHESVTIRASGGFPPYSFSILSGPGIIDSASGIYTAGGPGTARINIKDSRNLNEIMSIEVVDAYPLLVNPSSISVNIDSQFKLDISGGVPPYYLSILSGEGTVNSTDMTYKAPSVIGASEVRVRDSGGREGIISVNITTGVNYNAALANILITNNSGMNEVNGEVIVVRNLSDNISSTPVIWEVYASKDDAVLSSDDIKLDTGIISQNDFNVNVSQSAMFHSVMPDTPGAYYILLKIYSADDSSDSDNTISSGSFNITSGVDYNIEGVFNATISPVPGEPMQASFVFKNVGISDGSELVRWNVYLSENNNTLDKATDTLIDSGIHNPLEAVGSSKVYIKSSWPVTGFYYLIAEISSSDDYNDSNNLKAGPVCNLNPSTILNESVFIISNIKRQNMTFAHEDTSFKYSFDVTNIGDTAGDFSWELANSGFAVESSVSDITLSPGSKTTINVGYSNPRTWGNGKVAQGSVVAVEIKVSVNNKTHSTGDIFNDPIKVMIYPKTDYQLAQPPGHHPDLHPVLAVVSGASTDQDIGTLGVHKFSIFKADAYLGLQNVFWKVYVSLDNTVDKNDYILDQGLIAPISSTAVPTAQSGTLLRFVEVDITGNLPSAAGSYFMIIELESEDDLNNSDNIYVSPQFTVN